MIDYNDFPHLLKCLERYAIDARNLYKESLKKNDRFASGRLLNSVNYITEINGNFYEIFLSLEDYWKYVEEDTVPHRPPFAPIYEWVKIKPLLPTPYEQKYKWTTKDGKEHEGSRTILPTPKQIAYMVIHKIEEEGTEGSHDLEETMEIINQRYELKIAEALDQDLAYMVDIELQMLVKPFSNSNPYV